MSDWPTCPARVRLLDVELRCELPRHHEMDGTEDHSYHSEAGHVSWSIGVTRDE